MEKESEDAEASFVHRGQCPPDSLIEIVSTSGHHNLREIPRAWREVRVQAQRQLQRMRPTRKLELFYFEREKSDGNSLMVFQKLGIITLRLRIGFPSFANIVK